MEKPKQWTVEETNCLLGLWSSAEIQRKLEGAVRTKPVFEEIQRQMITAGYERSVDQLVNKLKKLKKDYRDMKREFGKSGNHRPRKSPHYDVLDAILGDRPACNATGAINSATAILEAMVDDSAQGPAELELPDEVEDEEAAVTPTPQQSCSQVPGRRQPSEPLDKRGKRKRDQDDLLEFMEKSDEKFFEMSRQSMQRMEADSAALLGFMGRIVAVMESQSK